MSLFDILQEVDLRDIRERLDRMQLQGDTANQQLARELMEAVGESRLRVGALVQLLIAKGVISAEEYAAAIAQARATKDRSE